MIREIECKQLVYGENPVYYKEFNGTSEDTKPTTNLATGSVFIEVDKGKAYLYDEDGETWHEFGGGNEKIDIGISDGDETLH